MPQKLTTHTHNGLIIAMIIYLGDSSGDMLF